MWGRRTEQSRGLDDRLIENAEDAWAGAGQDYYVLLRMDVQADLCWTKTAAWLPICDCSCASVSGRLLSNRGGEEIGTGIIRGFTSVTGEHDTWIVLQAATKIHT